MFSRKSTTERTAAQAWDYLSAAMTTVGDTARDAGTRTADLAGAKASVAGARATLAGAKAGELATMAGRRSSELAGDATRHLAGKTSRKTLRAAARKSTELADQAGARADVARARANAAANALAGRKPPLPWGLIIGVGLLSAALGWAAATTARAALERRAENEELELAETAVVVTPTYDN